MTQYKTVFQLVKLKSAAGLFSKFGEDLEILIISIKNFHEKFSTVEEEVFALCQYIREQIELYCY